MELLAALEGDLALTMLVSANDDLLVVAELDPGLGQELRGVLSGEDEGLAAGSLAGDEERLTSGDGHRGLHLAAVGVLHGFSSETVTKHQICTLFTIN